MNKLEYLTVIADLGTDQFETEEASYTTEDAMLEDLGLSGWELICVVPIVETFMEDTATKQLQYYFKRQHQD